MNSTPKCYNDLHFIFIPLMAPGHLLPMVDMAKLLARRKVKVTILTTPLNSIRFQSTIDREIQLGSQIQIVHIKFPSVESGIPEGCESVDTLPSMDLMSNFYIALCKMQNSLENVFEKLRPIPSCVISDKHISCVAEIAMKFKVPRIIFDGTNCFHLLCNHNLRNFNNIPNEGKFIVPGMPDQIELRKCQLPGLFNPGENKKLNGFREEVREIEEKYSYGVVVNSFEELEEKYVEEYKRVTGYKVWCVGPVSLSNNDELDKFERGKKLNSNDESQYDKILKWLDSWPSNSVIYVCLGSLNRATPQQLKEVGLGLEATKRPFIWVLRGAYGREEMEKWLYEEGFEGRVKNRGFLIKGWAPQVLILSHKAIGIFLTHCGWNSTLEGISCGVPLVTFPMFAEQFYNEKVVVQVVKNGVSVGAQSAVHLGEEEKCCVVVKRENVRDAIENVMGEGEEKEKIRGRARKYADMAREAIEEGGSSYRNMTLLIEDIMSSDRCTTIGGTTPYTTLMWHHK
ncbi:UDP-glucosyltransferase family protein [Medicago truncatula]|uniref:UDP-glucosyltransferase family protein n=2 Tax=Medicago truncatula TaxID=3880 RepID=G7L4X0_MEDTR|nr:UDP-glucosyltransferase family protein [Medicago truncatula]